MCLSLRTSGVPLPQVMKVCRLFLLTALPLRCLLHHCGKGYQCSIVEDEQLTSVATEGLFALLFAGDVSMDSPSVMKTVLDASHSS